MIINRLNDPFILNIKIELEGLRASLSYRERLQRLYKKSFTESQKNKGKKARVYSAMLNWNKLYINKLLKEINQCKEQLKALYECERKIIYMGQRREDSDK